MVYGNYRHSLDEKNRVRIPAKIRDAFTGKLFIMPGRTGCLYIVHENDVEEKTKKFSAADIFSDDEINDVYTAFCANTYELKEDPQGRIALTESIKNTAGIDKDIVFVGKGTLIEVWPSDVYDRKFGVLTPNKISEMLVQLKNRGN